MGIITERVDALRTPLIICCSAADAVIERWTVENPSLDRFFAFSDYIASEMAEFISQYRQNKLHTNHWLDSGSDDILPFEISSLEDEIKKNYLENVDSERLHYRRYLDYQVGEFIPKKEGYEKWLQAYVEIKDLKHLVDYDLEYLESGSTEEQLGSKRYTRKGLTDLFSYRLRELIYDLEKIHYTVTELDKVFDVRLNVQDQQAERHSKLLWKGDKTDLAELVWALAKSGRIADTSTGKDVTQKELAGKIATLLGLDSLDIANLMKGRYGTETKLTSYKVQNGKTFINELQKLVDKRVLD